MSSMHHRLGSVILSQLAFPEKSQWDNTVVKINKWKLGCSAAEQIQRRKDEKKKQEEKFFPLHSYQV